jgi:hypothetical protein
MAGKEINPGQIVQIGNVCYTALSDWGSPDCKVCDLQDSGHCDEYECLKGIYFVKTDNVNENMLKLFGSHLGNKK